MRCHFVYDKIAGKVLIPGCDGSLHRNDLLGCTCKNYPETEAGWEKWVMKETEKNLREEIKELKRELNESSHHIKYLTRIIDKLIGKNQSLVNKFPLITPNRDKDNG